MRVRLEKMMAGPAGIIHPGTIVNLAEDVALQLLRIQAATPVPGIIERTIEKVTGIETRKRRTRRGIDTDNRRDDRSNDHGDGEIVAEG